MMMKNFYLTKQTNGKLDKQVTAVCLKCEEKKIVTFRNIKNKWPLCNTCKDPMMVKT